MELPYSTEVYFTFMAEYNARWTIVVIGGAVFCIASLAYILFKGDAISVLISRLIGALLGLSWIWTGLVHQIGMMAELNFMAPIYGVAWLFEGAVLIWLSIRRDSLVFQVNAGFSSKLGALISVIGLLIYPSILFFSDHELRALPLAGTAPEPTLLFTAGILLMAKNSKLYLAFFIPACGAVVSGLSAYLLGFHPDYIVFTFVLIALLVAVSKNQNVRAQKSQRSRVEGSE